MRRRLSVLVWALLVPVRVLVGALAGAVGGAIIGGLEGLRAGRQRVERAWFPPRRELPYSITPPPTRSEEMPWRRRVS